MNDCRACARIAFALLILSATAATAASAAAALEQLAATAAVPSSAKMVDALNGVFHAHPHARANHANGMLLTAVFTPAPAAAGLSRAPHFTGKPSAVLVRFSNFGGVPDIDDADAGAAPYGMSLKFALEDDRETDLVMHSFNGFPSATAADFVDFLQAMDNSPPGAARPTALERYADRHPAAKAFLAAAKPLPLGFGTQAYFGVNTFKFTNAAGQVSYGRYRMVPVGAARFVDADAIGRLGKAYLRAEMRQRLARGPLLMRLQVQLAARGDALDDPSVAWPEDRPIVELGQLAIMAPVAHAALREQTVVFMPEELPDGIEAQDPMITARTRAYAESLERRLR